MLAPEQAPTVEACRSMLQHLLRGLLVGVLKHAAACRSTLKYGSGFFGKKYGTKISIPSLSTHLSDMASTLVVKCCIPVSTPFFAVLCFDRSLFSPLCLLMSTVEPTEEGATQPKRNKETTRSATDCLQWEWKRKCDEEE